MNPVEYYIAVGVDGDQYCALIGENLMEGESGFGFTVSDALRDLAAKLEGLGGN